jgi:nucleotide-binding universal stress UspA family protein
METPGIARIVVGLDGSEHSSFALAWAIRMARGMHSEVVAVYAIDLPVWFVSAAGPLPPQFDPEWRAAMQTEFEDRWCKPLRDAGVRYYTRMEDGRAASVINQVADEMEADVIVVGRRGRAGVAELVLGSVSHELVRHSKRPVLVISSPPALLADRVATGVGRGARGLRSA